MDIDEKLFRLLEDDKSILVLDIANIRDYFMFLALEIIKSENKKQAEIYIDKFEMYCKTKDKFLEGFFFTLANMLSLHFEIGTIEGDMIKKDNWKRSFKDTLRRIKWN